VSTDRGVKPEGRAMPQWTPPSRYWPEGPCST